ncbi:MAG TPA: maleylpyruvate isomerase N-terminal domain-containing protein [Humibacter sp.]|nr:maleylpyruvate isomerase N-terminal domain-containing protein [Humibacter sp.]
MAVVSLYVGTARSFARAVAEIPADAWESPGLGEWNVRALVGHAARALDTVLDYVSLPEPEEATLPTAESYLAALTAESCDLSTGADPAAITARGVAAGAALGEQPAASVDSKVHAVGLLLTNQSPGRLVAVRGGSIPLEEYLRTRVFELVVHTLDLTRATRIRADFPSGAVLEAARLAAGAAAVTGRGEEVLLALTGRGSLPHGFSVV